MRPNDAFRRAVLESVRSGMSVDTAANFYGLKPETIIRWAEGVPCDELSDEDRRLLRLESIVAELKTRIAELEVRG